MARFPVAAIQTTPQGDLERNLTQAADLMAQAVGEGARLLVLPENFAYGGGGDTLAAGMAEATSEGPARRFLADQARRHGVWIVGGTIPITDLANADKNADRRPFAALLVVDESGREVARYDKIHLFDVDVGDSHGSYRESRDYRPGSTPVTVDTPCGRLGLSVCYDLRFPELYRLLAEDGAIALVVPSAFTASTGEAHWELLMRARAVENLCYLVGANLGDRDHPRKPTWGGSAIIDPWGQVLASMDGGPGVVVAEIDTGRVASLREKMPVLGHRRFGVNPA